MNLSTLLEDQFKPCYRGITRPSLSNGADSGNDNFLRRTDDLAIESFNPNMQFKDHFHLFMYFIPYIREYCKNLEE